MATQRKTNSIWTESRSYMNLPYFSSTGFCSLLNRSLFCWDVFYWLPLLLLSAVQLKCCWSFCSLGKRQWSSWYEKETYELSWIFFKHLDELYSTFLFVLLLNKKKKKRRHMKCLITTTVLHFQELFLNGHEAME